MPHSRWFLRLLGVPPAFQAAHPAHIDLFAAANVRLWDEIALAGTSGWTAKMAQAAKSWAAYRRAR